jgi:hypothetical protein
MGSLTEPNVTSVSAQISDVALREVRKLRSYTSKSSSVVGSDATHSRLAAERGESKTRRSYLDASAPDRNLYIVGRRPLEVTDTVNTSNTKRQIPSTADMKVLLIGATGNLGLRLVAALLTHGHGVVAYVRSANKLESLLPASVHGQITVVEGDATASSLIKQTILDHDCDAAINCAGLAAMAPWSKSDLPEIFSAVLKGVQQAGAQRNEPLRAWFLGGMGALNFPGTDNMLSD